MRAEKKGFIRLIKKHAHFPQQRMRAFQANVHLICGIRRYNEVTTFNSGWKNNSSQKGDSFRKKDAHFSTAEGALRKANYS